MQVVCQKTTSVEERQLHTLKEEAIELRLSVERPDWTGSDQSHEFGIERRRGAQSIPALRIHVCGLVFLRACD